MTLPFHITLLERLFWLSAGMIVYVYLGYPLVLAALQVFAPRRIQSPQIQPSVSILIPVYNEAEVIAAKISNTLALDYPNNLLEIVIASDGSTDNTPALARSCLQGNNRIRLVEFPANRGKLAVLNDVVPQLRGEIVVFSDASAMLAANSLSELVAAFSDPKVGAASGVYRISSHEGASLGPQEDLYWEYETSLKKLESRLGVLTGAHGAFYAIRRSLYPFPPIGTINDDFLIPTSVLRQGYRIAYQTSAVAFDDARHTEGFQRRVRIAAGNFEQVGQVLRLVGLAHPLALLSFFSHKAGRLLVPFAMAMLFVVSALLWHHPLYRLIFTAQILFYVLALAGCFVRVRPAILRMPYYFCMVNAAVFVCLYEALFSHSGHQRSGSNQGRTVWN